MCDAHITWVFDAREGVKVFKAQPSSFSEMISKLRKQQWAHATRDDLPQHIRELSLFALA